jgi:uncharacterized membrane protein
MGYEFLNTISKVVIITNDYILHSIIFVEVHKIAETDWNSNLCQLGKLAATPLRTHFVKESNNSGMASNVIGGVDVVTETTTHKLFQTLITERKPTIAVIEEREFQSRQLVVVLILHVLNASCPPLLLGIGDGSIWSTFDAFLLLFRNRGTILPVSSAAIVGVPSLSVIIVKLLAVNR